MISLHEIKRTIKSVVSESRRDLKRGRIKLSEIYNMIMEKMLDDFEYVRRDDPSMQNYIQKRKETAFTYDATVDPERDKQKRAYLHPASVPVNDKDNQPIYIINKKGKKVRYNGVKNDANGEQYDIDFLRRTIMARPKKMLQTNAKMLKSGGVKVFYYNIGMPALAGLAVDEGTGDFIEVNTCPGAGACKLFCYAREGGYIQWKSVFEGQARKLNFLINDPAGFKNKLAAEIGSQYKTRTRKGEKMVVRWHDAGDFFSPSYFKIAKELAQEFPGVKFYGYSKIASSFEGQLPNLVMNFSTDAQMKEKQQVDIYKTKLSIVLTDISEKELKEFMEKKEVMNKDGEMEEQWVWTDLKGFKYRVAAKYNGKVFAAKSQHGEQQIVVNPDTLLSYDEMEKIPENPNTPLKWNVIVRPQGDGDDSASRSDVWITFLIMH